LDDLVVFAHWSMRSIAKIKQILIVLPLFLRGSRWSTA